MDDLKLCSYCGVFEFEEGRTNDFVFACFGEVVDTYLKGFV